MEKRWKKEEPKQISIWDNSKLDTWIECAQWYYPLLSKWQSEQIEYIESDQNTNKQEIGNRDEIYNEDNIEQMPKMDARKTVYDEQSISVERFWHQALQDTKNIHDVSDIINRTNRILILHNENRENLVNEAMKMRRKANISERRLTPEVEKAVQKAIGQRIQEYLKPELDARPGTIPMRFYQ